MRSFWHNWKTNVAGLVAFLSFGVSHQTTILPLLPPQYLHGANTVFVIAGLVLAFYAKDAGNHALPIVSPPASAPPAATAPQGDPGAAGQ